MTILNSSKPVGNPRATSVEWPAGPTVDGCPHQAYSEDAFRYFLGLERKRAERSGRSLLLLLADVAADSATGAAIPPALSAKLFSALNLCVRDVDFIGWYRDGRVAGAVLTQGAETPALEVSDEICKRVTDLLRERLPEHVARRLNVRVLQARQTVQV
jgi:hypothetical protein